MDSKSKGIAWVGNIYQKFEAMCVEVDDMVYQETMRFVENHLQPVGANVKQFCTELMQDVLPSSTSNSVEELNLPLVQNDGVTACEGSNISVDEDKSLKELIHSSSVQSVEDVHFGLCSEQSTKVESALAHFLEELNLSLVQNAGVAACENSNTSVDEDISMKELIHSSSVQSVEDVQFDLSSEQNTKDESALAHSVEELNFSLVQNAGLTACESSNISVDEDKTQKELIHSSSVQSVEDVDFDLSSDQSTKDESALAHLGFIPSDFVSLAEACKNELQDIDSTLDDTSLETMEEALHKFVKEVELEAALKFFDKVRLEESCIIVDSGELQSLSDEAGKLRSDKKKFLEALASKLRFIKQDQEQHAGLGEEKGKNVGLSSQTDKAKSRDMEFSDSDWELV